MKKVSPKNKQKLEFEKNVLNDIDKLKKNNLINSYIGNKGYTIYKICLTDNIIKYIKEILTVKPFSNNIGENESFPIYQENEKKLYLPKFYGISLFDYPKSFNISDGKNINIKFLGNLRKEPVNQEEIVNKYLTAINFDKINNKESNEKDLIKYKSSAGALIDLKCGGGKTILALYLISVIKKKTIIFVHKTFLKNQWIERIQEFLPDAKIGCIQGQIIDIEDKDIVIAMIQSISMKSYPNSLFESFGFSIYDECHHLSSEVFNNCFRTISTLYNLGLSATMNRKDGLTFVFKMNLGDICYKSKENLDEDNVIIKAIEYKIDDDDYNEVERDFRGNVKYSTMVSKISNYEYRSNFIVDVINNELYINNNQQILVLAHTRAFLNFLYKKFKLLDEYTIGYYVGGMKEKDLKESENKTIILATYQMAAEGLDIKSLTTLFLATPKSDIVQAVGRILRQKHSQPLILDIIDSHEPFLNQFNKRKSYYNSKNYKIYKTSYNDYINYIKDCKKNINIEPDVCKLWNELKNNKSKNKNKEIINKECICLI